MKNGKHNLHRGPSQDNSIKKLSLEAPDTIFAIPIIIKLELVKVITISLIFVFEVMRFLRKNITYTNYFKIFSFLWKYIY